MNTETEMTPVRPGETFCFDCSPEVPCFNDCCRDLNQFLTPYDVLRLKTRLGLRSADFLDRYATVHAGPQTGLPVASFRTDPDAGHACPFVSPEGCRVYPDRPGACRTYPLARLVSRDRATGDLTETYMILREAHCRGFESDRTQSLAEWIEAQGIAPYNEMNDRLMEIIAVKNRRWPGPLDPRTADRVRRAFYDIDGFRESLADGGLPSDFDLDPARRNRALEDDLELLRLATDWVRHLLLRGA